MTKDIFIAAHEELIDEYLVEHPDVDWRTAYEVTSDRAYNRYVDKYADMVDRAKQRAKDEGRWPPSRAKGDGGNAP